MEDRKTERRGRQEDREKGITGRGGRQEDTEKLNTGRKGEGEDRATGRRRTALERLSG